MKKAMPKRGFGKGLGASVASAPPPSLSPSPLPAPPPVKKPAAANLNDPSGAGMGPIGSLASPSPLPPGKGTATSGVGDVLGLQKKQGLGPATLPAKSKAVRRPGLSRTKSAKTAVNPRRPGKRTIGNS